MNCEIQKEIDGRRRERERKRDKKISFFKNKCQKRLNELLMYTLLSFDENKYLYCDYYGSKASLD